jgi:hypothetical protein
MSSLQKRRILKLVLTDEYDIWGSDGGKHLGYGRVGCGADCMPTSQRTVIVRNIEFQRKRRQPHGPPGATFDN